MIDTKNLTIKKAHEHMKNGDFSAVELTESYLKTIEEKNPEINAYLEVFDDAREQAAAAQKKFDAGEADILTGIPLAMKDNLCIKDRKVSAASKVLEGYTAPYSGTVAQKLIDAQTIFLGRTNMDEFAHGSSTENSGIGITRNPVDTERIPGGSSGGSAAVLAMDGALAAFGSDTGGSIRYPAHCCGVVGLKPTYGSVSRHGLLAMGSSFDVIGPFAKTVEDAEILFNATKGIDTLDSTTVEGDFSGEVKTIGVPRDFLASGMDEDAKASFEASVKQLEQAGYTVVDISIPNIEYALAVYYVLVPAEISSNMARFDGVKYGAKKEGGDLLEDYFATRGELLGPEVKRRIMLGTYVLSAGYADQYYDRAWQVRNLIKQSFVKVFEEVDAIAMPTGIGPAIKIGEKSADPLSLYLLDIFTVAANVAGIPAMSVPAGTVEREGKDLPVSVQLLAPHLHENRLFEVGKKFEEVRGN